MTVGCGTFSFEGKAGLLDALEWYFDDPEACEKAYNAAHGGVVGPAIVDAQQAVAGVSRRGEPDNGETTQSGG